MAGENDGLEGIDIDLGQGGEGQTGQQPAKKPEETPDQGVEALRAQLAEERAGRIRAEGAAREASDRAAQAARSAHSSDLNLVSNSIELVKQNQEQLKAAYADAAATGDFAKMADIQVELSTAAATLIELQRGKTKMEAQAREPARVDKVEALARQLPPASAAWIRQHPEYARDDRLYRKMLRAHEDAVDEGIEPDSPEYFAHVERTLGIGHSDTGQGGGRRASGGGADVDLTGGVGGATASGGRSASAEPPAAPVSRAPAGPGSQRSTTIRLTAEQIEMAEACGQTPEEYAKELAQIRAEGKPN